MPISTNSLYEPLTDGIWTRGQWFSRRIMFTRPSRSLQLRHINLAHEGSLLIPILCCVNSQQANDQVKGAGKLSRIHSSFEQSIMELRFAHSGKLRTLMSQLLTLLLISLRVPLPLSLILPPKYGSRHSPSFQGSYPFAKASMQLWLHIQPVRKISHRKISVFESRHYWGCASCGAVVALAYEGEREGINANSLRWGPRIYGHS